MAAEAAAAAEAARLAELADDQDEQNNEEENANEGNLDNNANANAGDAPIVNPPPPLVDPPAIQPAVQAILDALQQLNAGAAVPNAQPQAIAPPVAPPANAEQLAGIPQGPGAPQVLLPRRRNNAAAAVDALIGARVPIRDPAFPPVPRDAAGDPPKGIAKIQAYNEVDITTWTEWKFNWLRMARICQWDDVIQIDTIKNYFQGEALRRTVGIMPDPGDNILDYLDKLEQVLVPSASSAEARGEYHALAQKPKESAVAYRGRAVLLLRRAYAGRDPETDTEFLLKFVQGIWADPIRKNLLLNFPTTLTEAYNKLSTTGQFVTEYQNDKTRSALQPKAAIQAINTPQGNVYRPTRPGKTAAELREEDDRYSRCFYCHTSGHMASECPVKRQPRENTRPASSGRFPSAQRGRNTYLGNRGNQPNRRYVGAIDDDEDADLEPSTDELLQENQMYEFHETESDGPEKNPPSEN